MFWILFKEIKLVHYCILYAFVAYYELCTVYYIQYTVFRTEELIKANPVLTPMGAFLVG